VQVRHGPAAVRGVALRPNATGLEAGKAVGEGAPSQKTCRFAFHPVPLAEGGNVLRRSFVMVLFGLLLAGCGGADGQESASVPGVTGAAEEQAAVFVTTDCGKTTLIEKTAVEPENAMRALDRIADIETDDGGKFVTAIEGAEQNTGKKLAWLFYVNGAMAKKGATEIELEPGDVEWWDLHNYEQECATVPAEAQ
jgi:Domain of unknown function (DUF4430)